MAGTVNLTIPDQVDSRRAILARWLWPPRCLLCGERGAGDDLCGACAAGLPWLSDACRRCALPLPVAGPLRAGPPEQYRQTDGNAAAVRPAGEPAANPSPLCGACIAPDARSPLAEVHAACLYRPPLDRLLPRFKFRRDLAAGRLLARLMSAALAPVMRDWPAPAMLLPVPLHRARLRQRGYDQALELARPLASMLGLPLQAGALVRTRHTDPQSTLGADARRANLRGAFRVASSVALPAHVVLVDDVMTTGATLHAAATALRRAGVERVDAWVCARVP